MGNVDTKLEKGKLYRYTGLSNWSLGTSFEPCSPLVNELAEIYDKAVAGEATEKDVKKFFDELTKPSREIPVTGFSCGNEGELHTSTSNIGKVELKPWKPQYNEKVLYKFRKDSKFREGIYVGKNPLFSQENNYPHVVICNTSDPIKACEIKPFRDQKLIADDIENFVETMNEKLEENNHKGYWGDMDFRNLFCMLQDEVKELGAELISPSEGKYDGVMREAADVGNFAMMIHSIAKIRRDKSIQG